MTLPTAATMVQWFQPLAALYLRHADQLGIDQRYFTTTEEALQHFRARALTGEGAVSDEPRRIAHHLVRHFDSNAWAAQLSGRTEPCRRALWDTVQDAAQAFSALGVHTLVRNKSERQWVDEIAAWRGRRFGDALHTPLIPAPGLERTSFVDQLQRSLDGDRDWSDRFAMQVWVHYIGAMAAVGDGAAVNLLLSIYQESAGPTPGDDHAFRSVLASELEWVSDRRAVLALLNEAQRKTAHWSNVLRQRIGLELGLEAIIATERAERAQWRLEAAGEPGD